MDYRVTNDLGSNRADEIISHLTRPRLWVPESDYPDYQVWIEKAHAQIKSGSKRAMVAIEKDNIIGLVLYQLHKNESNTIEIKNISVRPGMEGRHIASFLLRNAEIEGVREYGTTNFICDTKSSNTGMRLFLLRHRYFIQDITDLYGLSAGKDLVFRKTHV